MVFDSYAEVPTNVAKEIIAKAGTILGHDDGEPVTTPYDDCVLIMPTKRLKPGQTAVRLGRYIAA